MRARLLIPCAFLLVYAYSFPYFAKLRSANELPRIFLTTQMVDAGTFRINDRMGELGSTFDVSTTPDGGKYSNKAPGLSFMAVPPYLALKAWHGIAGGEPSTAELTWMFRFTTVTLPALLFIPFFLAFARRFAPLEAFPPRVGLAAFALGSMAMPYAILFFSHHVAGVFAGAAFIAAVALVREPPAKLARRDLWAVLTGVFAGMAVLVDYQSALAGLAVGIYLLVRSPRRWRDAGLAAAGSVPPALLLFWYHWACFGSPLKTGYSFAADQAHKQGVLGIIGPNGEAMYNALLAPDNGLVTLAPWVLLAVVGAVRIARSAELREHVGAEALVCGIVTAGYVLFVGSLVPEFGRAGWSVGPRYITVAMPFCAWLAVAGFSAADRRTPTRVLALAAAWVGIGVFSVAAATYPHWPTPNFPNPVHQVSLRLVGEGMAPHSIGTAIGLPGTVAYGLLFASVIALAAWLMAGRDRARWIAVGVAAALAAVVIAGYAWFPSESPTAERGWRFIERTWEP